MLTVTDVLERRELALEALVVADPSPPVRWVATSELADPSPFLEGGEVLLTTGIGTAGWQDEWQEYVDRLVGARVAALGLASGLTHEVVPQALVRACEERRLTLFDVPRRTTFVAISRTVAGLLEEQSALAARQALAMQRDLTQAALRRDDPTAVLRRLADLVRGTVATLTADGRWEVAPLGAEPDRLDLVTVAGEVARLQPQGLRASTAVTTRLGTTVVQPLGLRGTPASYLAAWLPGPLDDPRRGAVTTAVALVSLAIESRNDRRETSRRLRRRALELLVDGDPRTAAVVLAAATETAPGTGPAEVRLAARLQLLAATGPEERLDHALDRIEQAAAGAALPLAARAEDRLWVACAPAEADRLAAVLVADGLRVALGSVVPRSDLAQSRAAAEHALGHTGDETPLVRWEELVGTGVPALLDAAAADPFADAFLAPLDRYGERREELLDTLRLFLQHHGRVGPLAEELGVHRNTARNRLRDIEAALGRSLDDPQVRVNAWVALELRATRRLRGRASGQRR